MLSARSGLRSLQRLAGLQHQQLRYVGDASKLFPDLSEQLGGEWHEDGEMGAFSGMPKDYYNRVATIFSPCRSASQQGQSKVAGPHAKGPVWRIGFEVQQKWQNPLTGWTSSADPLETVSRGALTFDSKEAAIGYAKQMGFRTVVREPNIKRPDRLKRFAGYGDNFSVKRHGYPVGGMRSESPMKKQAATEEQHLETPDDVTAQQIKAPSPDEQKPKKGSKKKKDA